MGSVPEGAGAVAADHPHLGMISQPGREGARGAVGKNVDRTVGGHVDEDRRVGPSASHGELVDAEKRDRARGQERQRADQPEQSVLAGADSHAFGEACSCPADQEQGHVGELGSESFRAACVAPVGFGICSANVRRSH
ncbi:hypothetical protein OG298_02425 [Streptomyces sp. NBC_01005]|nr:hypothetical protein [Streptomyces sp. NBC_01362]WSW03299.1 hypothetical protein OG298_02425 [Streptomyces sp. NBC_01005]WTC92801.1 hypothetical protein OH736_02410 [Streptomyces sp. NBC_01650]